MDKTAYCRNRCASSADMLACMRDCDKHPMNLMGSPIVNPLFKARAPKLTDVFKMEGKTAAAVAVAAIAVVGLGVFLLARKK